MRYYKKTNVLEEALDRIRYLFDEFPNIIVNISGGKDSTVVFNLAMQVAKEKNRLPLKVSFIDQEAEWDIVIEHIRTIMYRDDVDKQENKNRVKFTEFTSHHQSQLLSITCPSCGGQFNLKKVDVINDIKYKGGA